MVIVLFGFNLFYSFVGKYLDKSSDITI